MNEKYDLLITIMKIYYMALATSTCHAANPIRRGRASQKTLLTFEKKIVLLRPL